MSMPKNKSSPGEKADFFAFPSRFTILGQVRKNTIPIYLPTKRPRIGTIMKNHIQSSSGLSKAALFVCSESDTSLKNYTIKSNEKEAENPVFTRDCRHDTGCGKLSIFVGWHRGFTRSLRRFECFWLFDFKTGHEPVELLPGQLLYFQLISGPAESALDFHTFIQKQLSKNSNNSFY